MGEEICTTSKYSNLINEHTKCFERFLKEFETEDGNEINPSVTVLRDCLEFSENIEIVIPDITPVRYEILGRIEAAHLALAQEHFEKAHNHIIEAVYLWNSIIDALYDFDKTACEESFFCNGWGE